MPSIQQWVVKLIIICPVYAICSALAISLGPQNGMYAEICRDLYESFAVYSLLNLIMEYCGGETDCVYAIENEPMLRMPFPFCISKPRPRDAKLLRFCQKGVLQFVVTKPIMAISDALAFGLGYYYNTAYQVCSAIVYNLSYGMALYCLLCFYLATKQHIKKYHPACKILTVKMLIIICYYQSLLVKIAPVTNDEQFLWKSLILCIEMVLFSIAFTCAFPVSEFLLGIPDRRILENFKDLLTIRDIFEGIEHNFKPVYRDYSLQRSETEAPETVRLRTFFAGNLDNVAMDLAEKYRGKNKRLAFNSLLRGNKPIAAGLRKGRSSSDNSLDSQNSADFESALRCDGVESERGHPGGGQTGNPLLRIETAEPLLEGDDDGLEEKEAPKQFSFPTSPPSKVVPRLAPPPSQGGQQQEQQEEQNPMRDEFALEEGEWGDFVGDDLRRQQVEE